MNVFYDYEAFTMQAYGGISRYFYELVNRYDNKHDFCKVGMTFSNNEYLNHRTYSSVLPFFPKINFKGKNYLYHNINKRTSVSELRRKNFDIFHPTYYDNYFLNDIGSKPFVITFFDMIHEKFINQYKEFNNSAYLINYKRELALKASRIIAISETTKNDIVDIYGIDRNKIDVVYLGNSLFLPDKNSPKIVEKNYVLFVGNRSLYKNFTNFVTVISSLLFTNDLFLVCAGGGEFSFLERDFINKLGLNNRVILVKFLNDTILSNLYANALFFVFPSLYEGFGIPLLESFASGCPVLSSNAGSLPEIAGDAAIFFDINDNQSLFKSFEMLVFNEVMRLELIKKGELRLNQFSWDNTFNETKNIYKTLI